MDAQPPSHASTAPANTVYFHGGCPASRAGVRAQKALMGAVGQCELMWVDVSEEPAALGQLGLSLDALREKLAVTDGLGRVHQGPEALALLLDHTRGLRWLARVLRYDKPRRLVGRAYDRLALRLYAWNVKHKRWPPNRAQGPASAASTPATTAPSLATLLALTEDPQFHAAVLGDRHGAYSLGVGRHPASENARAIVVQVEGEMPSRFAHLSFKGQQVPVLWRGGFSAPSSQTW